MLDTETGQATILTPVTFKLILCQRIVYLAYLIGIMAKKGAQHIQGFKKKSWNIVYHNNENCQVHYNHCCMDKKNTFYALVTAESVKIVKATDLNYPSVVGTLLNALKTC